MIQKDMIWGCVVYDTALLHIFGEEGIMEQRYYKMADFELKIETPCAITVTGESRDFCHRTSANAAEQVTFEAVEHLPEMPEQGVWYSDCYYTVLNETDAVYIRALPREAPYAVIQYTMTGGVRCLYVKNTRAMVWDTQYLLNMIGLEKILMRQKALILHASFIKWNEKGILFSAPSGTGKSTQADLWQKHLGAEIINGDRAGIRKKDGLWRAYGLPYAGSSKIYRNESASLNAIVVLEQAEENSIRLLGQTDSVTRLLPEFSLHRWDARFMNEAMDLITEIVERVPIYLLKCRPDVQAVELLKETIEKEEMK